jgi:hypothetical protein
MSDVGPHIGLASLKAHFSNLPMDLSRVCASLAHTSQYVILIGIQFTGL